MSWAWGCPVLTGTVNGQREAVCASQTSHQTAYDILRAIKVKWLIPGFTGISLVTFIMWHIPDHFYQSKILLRAEQLRNPALRARLRVFGEYAPPHHHHAPPSHAPPYTIVKLAVVYCRACSIGYMHTLKYYPSHLSQHLIAKLAIVSFRAYPTGRTLTLKY